MKYNEKLHLFFKSKGLSQKDVAKSIGYSPAMISRYLSGVSVFPPEFLSSLIKNYPDIDLRYIFTEEEIQVVNAVQESTANYQLSNDELIKELESVEEKIAIIKNVLARKNIKKE